MVIIHRSIRRLKDTFQRTRSRTEIKPQDIVGRRVLNRNKLASLPLHRDSNYNVNFNETSLKNGDEEQDCQQTKLKTMLLDELKGFFADRNQNNHSERNTFKSDTKSQSHQEDKSNSYPSLISVNHLEQIVEHVPFQTTANRKPRPSISPALLISISLVISILLSSDLIASLKKICLSFHLLTNTVSCFTSFLFGSFGARLFKQTKPFHVHCFKEH